jgi:glucose-6-phosphate 1-epimerase
VTSPSDLQSLNQRFGQPGLAFESGPGGLAVATIANHHGEATVALHGGHVLAFQPRGHKPVLWVSRQSRYAAGTPIRGGIPVCWPWFGPHPVDAAKPAHGFARISSWSVIDGTVGEITRLRLALTDSAATQALWPYPFRLELTVTVGHRFEVDLLVRNPGPEPFTCAGALHSYFAVSDIAGVAVDGLQGCAYLDKAANYERREQTGPIAIAGETDRVYLDTIGDCTISDAGWQRTVRVGKRGSRTTVVWNPWVARARQLADFGDDEYREMICVETANTADDQVTVQPFGEHRLVTILSAEPPPT